MWRTDQWAKRAAPLSLWAGAAHRWIWTQTSRSSAASGVTIEVRVASEGELGESGARRCPARSPIVRRTEPTKGAATGPRVSQTQPARHLKCVFGLMYGLIPGMAARWAGGEFLRFSLKRLSWTLGAHSTLGLVK